MHLTTEVFVEVIGTAADGSKIDRGVVDAQQASTDHAHQSRSTP